MINKVILMGRICNDVNLATTPSGVASCRFTVAVDRGFKSKDGEKQTDFIRVTAWRATAEFVSKYFSKGKMIIVEGSLRNNDYEKDGVKHYSMDVQADKVSFGGSKSDDNSGTAGTENAQAAPSSTNSNGFDPALDADIADFEEIISGGDVPF